MTLNDAQWWLYGAIVPSNLMMRWSSRGVSGVDQTIRLNRLRELGIMQTHGWGFERSALEQFLGGAEALRDALIRQTVQLERVPQLDQWFDELDRLSVTRPEGE